MIDIGNTIWKSFLRINSLEYDFYNQLKILFMT